MLGGLEIRLPKGPWKFNGEDSGPLTPAVPRGAHNREVLSQIGIDEAQIKLWEERGVLSSDA